MSLSAGSRLGSYEIVSPLGAGGMGEVWRARDPRLGREVAIKVLPESFAADPERLARFRREAHVLAALNHPHVGAIYGVEEIGAAEALVLELVEGETLAERIARGPLPVNEALEISEQITEALEAAHERGIVHRDLKPSNVKLTPEGKVKVLDFGLAKALAGDAVPSDVSISPTLTAAATQAGVVIGTAAYMSPEQARGRSVDRRADIWAFGAILWEMLTGRRLFEGETVSDVLAGVLRQEIPFNALPPETPEGIVRLLRRCLERDPRIRLHDMGDARLEIEEAMRAPAPSSRGEAPVRLARRRVAQWLPWAIAGIAFVAVALLLRRPSTRAAEVVRLSVALPDKVVLDPTVGDQVQILAISPDGRRVAFRGRKGDENRIYVRDLSHENAEGVPGTEGGGDPFFSPDGEWLGFVAGDKLKKTAVRGGTPISLAVASRSRGAVWGPDGTIVFSPSVNSPLFRIPAAGGEATPLTALDAATRERTHRWPEIVPEGRWVLFTVGTEDKPGDYEDSRIDAVSLETGKRHTVYRGASFARYLPPGELLLARRGDVLAVPFDPRTATVHRASVPVLQAVSGDPRSGVSYFSVSKSGAMLFAVGLSAEGTNDIVWIDRAGRREPTGIPSGVYTALAISPDGQKLAYAEGPGGGSRTDIWIADLAHSNQFQLTSTGAAASPRWTPDGASVVFSTPTGDAVMRQRADGSAPPEVLWRPAYRVPITDDSFAPDGSALLLTLSGLPTRNDIFLLPLSGDRTARPLIATPGAEFGGMISPDGRWIAYTGEYEGGLRHIYVQRYPTLAGRWQVSRNGGAAPRWSRDGKELFFFWNDEVLAAPVQLAPTFAPGEPRPLFKIEHPATTNEYNDIYDVAPDGKRFIVVVRQKENDQAPRLDVILNFGSRLPGATR
ncbi:MAG: protein kinase domain-containing protein [Gemmatimonadota bacterium]